MSKPLRNKKLKSKIKSKSREWKYLKESKEDLNFLFSLYEKELNQVLSDLSQFSPKPKKEDSEPVSIPIPDSEDSYDDSGNIEVSEKIPPNSPSWAKKLYKQIAIHTHPDKLQGMQLTEDEKLERENIFKNATESLKNSSYEDLIYNAHKLNLDIGVEDEEYLKILESSIENLTKDIESEKNKAAWTWGTLEGDLEQRCNFLYYLWGELGEPSPPKEIVESYLVYFENDTISEWKLKYPQRPSKVEENPPQKRSRPGPRIGDVRRGVNKDG